MKHKILGLLVGGLTLAATASPAYAAKVTVEVEGLNLNVPPTTVDTPASVSKGGGSCPGGANVLGALDALTKGDWDGSVNGATRILAEDHPWATGTPGWVFVINGKATSDFGCGATVADGDKLLWYASAGSPHFRASSGWDDPVLLDAPATAVPGHAFTITATDTTTSFSGSYDDVTGTSFAPSGGATVSGGTTTATTGADGTAQVTVAPGPYTLVATKANRAPARISGCATTGSDGFCGTTATATTTATPAAPCATAGNDGFCGTPDKRAANGAFTTLPEGKKYKKGKGPRELRGHVADEPSGLADVRVRLTRTNRSCSTFDAKKERFVAMRKCGAVHGKWFSVGAKQDFTYLLPAKLGTGRYVLDLQVVDKAGNKTAALARGTTRVVFTVA